MQHEVSDTARKIELAMEAIVTKSKLEVTYNGATLELCPHQLFVRHDSVYLRAFNPNKSRRVDEEPSLGSYKIDGLSGLNVTKVAFDPIAANDDSLRDSDRLLIDVHAL